MTLASAKTIAREFWESWGRGDLEATWTDFVSEDIVIHPSSGYEFTRRTWLEADQALHNAFDDIEIVVLDQIEEVDMVATRWSVTGRQKSEFFGVPSSGKTATLTATVFDRVKDGKVIEHWAEVAVPQFLQQLSA
ncbi:ester cyclase [Rhodococcoides fascians A21d2]|uniref:ester cyclase n=1 Tax=Rhodococcoides fascians TaxID=1828 RepID=UPI00055C2FB0|nr:ester cyclase [Rhodococcus fascians]QII00236.1 ester cyclase [Rhodococcus fascians A21d2]